MVLKGAGETSLEEKLLKNTDGIIRVSNFMSNCSRISEDLVIVATRLALITEKVDFIIVFLNELQAVAFVPALGENIEGDLASNREGKKLITELLLQFLNECLTNSSTLVELFEFITLFS